MSSTKHTKEKHKEATIPKGLPANSPFVFSRMNYIIALAALAVVIIGFVLMSGTKGDIYDFRRITLAPIVVVAGFGLGFVAIFWKDKKSETDQHSQE